MKRRAVHAFVVGLLIAATMVVTHALAFNAIMIQRDITWTPIVASIASVPYWMMFAPLLFLAKPDGILDTRAAEWICATIMGLFWGLAATYAWDGVKKLGMVSRVVAGGITVAVVFGWLSYSVQQSAQTGSSPDIQVARTQHVLGNLVLALEAYHNRYNKFPRTIEDLNAGFPGLEFPFDLVDPIENGVFFRQRLIYEVNDTQTEYTLLSVGLDGVEGTADDLVRHGRPAQQGALGCGRVAPAPEP